MACVLRGCRLLAATMAHRKTVGSWCFSFATSHNSPRMSIWRWSGIIRRVRGTLTKRKRKRIFSAGRRGNRSPSHRILLNEASPGVTEIHDEALHVAAARSIVGDKQPDSRGRRQTRYGYGAPRRQKPYRGETGV